MKFELRKIDAHGNKEEGFTHNETFHIGYMHTRAENIKQAITRNLRMYHGILFKRGATRIEFVYDRDIYEIRCRKSGIPFIAAIPIHERKSENKGGKKHA